MKFQKNKFLNTPNILILLIIFIGGFLRFYNYTKFSYNNDELSELLRVEKHSFKEIIFSEVWKDIHPAGKMVFAKLWTTFFGISEASVRFPFIIAGILSIFLIFLLAKKWFNQTTALFSALMLAILEYPITFSWLSRTYSTGLALILLTAILWTKVLFDKKTHEGIKVYLYPIALGLLFALCAYNHYMSALMAVIIGITGLFFTNYSNYKKYFIACLTAFILFIPHIPLTLYHLSKGGLDSWLSKPDIYTFTDYIFFTFNYSWSIIIFIIIAASVSIFFNYRNYSFNKFSIIAFVWFVSQFLILFTYSIKISPMLQFSGLLFSFPFLLIFIFGFFNEQTKTINLLLFIMLATLGLYNLLFTRNYFWSPHNENFKKIAETIFNWDKEFVSDSITHTIVINNIEYLNFYLKKHNHTIDFKQSYNKCGEDNYFLKRILDSAKTPFFLQAQTFLACDESDALIRAYYPCLIKEEEFGEYSFVRLYSKNNNKCIPPIQAEKVYICQFDSDNNMVINKVFLDSNKALSPYYSIKLDNTKEFGPLNEYILGEQSKNRLRKVRISFDVYIPNKVSAAQFVAEIKTSNPTKNLWSSVLIENFADTEKWQSVYKTVFLSKHYSNMDTLRIYMWNPKKELLYYDNLKVSFYK